ncbi:MAG: hypothetical protein AAGD32_14755 [Planctomycetota bacterium]
MRHLLPFLLLAALIVGCGPSAETRAYRVTVVNATQQPLTVWLTKNGPPFEELWATPEDLAHPVMGLAEKEGAVLEPGDVGTIPGGPAAFEGKFYPRTDAVLRVYSGRRTFNEMLAASRSAGTLEIFVLPAGSSQVTVTESFPVAGQVTVAVEQ